VKPRPLWPLLPPLVALGVMVILLGFAHITGGLALECALHKFTGLYCPGCGGTRCASALLHGNFAQAWGFNAMLTLGAIAFALCSFYLIARITLLGKSAPKRPVIPTQWYWAGLAGLLLFTVLRNTQTFAWLAP
jgi:hypothetical protein